MRKPPLPSDEEERLLALMRYAILDTPPEGVFDDAVRLAAQICGTPIALVTLVDRDRQWFKAKLGLDVSETSRDVSFCGHAILQKDLFVVADAREDPRFSDNPLVVADPPIVFYAGVPLITPDGHALGTICVKDHVPRILTTHEREALRTLGRLVTRELELRRQLVDAVTQSVEESDGAQIRNGAVWRSTFAILGTGAPAVLFRAGTETAEIFSEEFRAAAPRDPLQRDAMLRERMRTLGLGRLLELVAVVPGQEVRALVEGNFEVFLGAGSGTRCHFLRAFLATAVPALLAQPELGCRETACQGNGSDACVFELTPSHPSSP